MRRTIIQYDCFVWVFFTFLHIPHRGRECWLVGGALITGVLATESAGRGALITSMLATESAGRGALITSVLATESARRGALMITSVLGGH